MTPIAINLHFAAGICAEAPARPAGSIARRSYSDYENQQWIVPPTRTGEEMLITLVFSEFNTEQSYDIVRVYQCADSSCSVRTQLSPDLSGFLSPAPTISVTGPGPMMVTWLSDFSYTRSGWAATWTVTANTGESVEVRPVARHGCVAL